MVSGQLLTSLNRRADYYAATFLDVIIRNGNYWCNNSLLNILKNKLSSVILSVTHFVHSSKVYQCTGKFLFLLHRFNIRFVSARFFGKLPLLFVLVSRAKGCSHFKVVCSTAKTTVHKSFKYCFTNICCCSLLNITCIFCVSGEGSAGLGSPALEETAAGRSSLRWGR